jgi:putative hydrolase of the HAD superfamily
VNGPAVIRAVTLDVDGTLYSIQRMVVRHMLTMLPVRDFFQDLHKIRDKMRGEGPFQDFRKEQARRLAELRGISAEQAEQQVHAIVDERWMKVFKKVSLFKGVRETLFELEKRGVRLGLISDYPILEKLKGMGLSASSFGTIVVTEDVGALKPHPAAFELAAEELGLEPGQVLHVGDREDCDVDGALAAGMQAALFCRDPKNTATKAGFLFSSWRDFISEADKRGLLNVRGA